MSERGSASRAELVAGRPAHIRPDDADGLCLTPNQHARRSGCRLRAGVIDLFGYQEFTASRNELIVSPVDVLLSRKARLLSSVMRPSRLAGRTVLDLGANNGYFSLAALKQRASSVTAVDLDGQCIKNMVTAREHLQLDRLDVVCANVVDWTEPADCVFALALSHWLVACTATFGSLDAVVAHLAQLTRYLLVLEFVEERDSCIQRFGHLTWHGRQATGYSREAFEIALHRHFARIRRLGDVSSTRSIYAAYKTAMDIDLSGPLPLRHAAERLLACRYLATIAGQQIWSAVFDLGDCIVKQTTGSLALHEARILQRLQETTEKRATGSGVAADAAGNRLCSRVPRVLGWEEGEGWSAVTLERIDGVPLTDAIDVVASSRREFVRFACACLDVLLTLRTAGVVHRDVHAKNILVRAGLPVLMDFGWAVAPGLDVEVPQGLWTWERSMDESDATPEHCDVRSFGRMLLDVSQGRYPDLDALFGLMAEPDGSLRVRDIELLHQWLTFLDSTPDESSGVRQLLMVAEGRRRRANALNAAAARAQRANADPEADLKLLDHTTASLHARLDAALISGKSITDLREVDALHLITYTYRLCEQGAVARAQSVAACVVRTLDSDRASDVTMPLIRPDPESPAAVVFASIGRALEEERHHHNETVTPTDESDRNDWVTASIEAREIMSRAAFELAKIIPTSKEDEARRYLQHCLSVVSRAPTR